jgi:hypothetical protein
MRKSVRLPKIGTELVSEFDCQYKTILTDLIGRGWVMKTATATQNVTCTASTRLAKALASSWPFRLLAGRLHWQPAMATVKHRQSPQESCVPHPPASTFSMLVESDVLRGSRSVFP